MRRRLKSVEWKVLFGKIKITRSATVENASACSR